MLVKSHLQGYPGLVALALVPIEIFWAPPSLLQLGFQPKRTLYWREEFYHVLAASKRPGIATATGNSVVTDLELDIRGWAAFSLTAELGRDPAQGTGGVGGVL